MNHNITALTGCMHGLVRIGEEVRLSCQMLCSTACAAFTRSVGKDITSAVHNAVAGGSCILQQRSGMGFTACMNQRSSSWCNAAEAPIT